MSGDAAEGPLRWWGEGVRQGGKEGQSGARLLVGILIK